MEGENLVLSALERIEKRLDKQETKLDSVIETVNAMKVNAAGCTARFKSIESRQDEQESKGEKRRESAGTWVGIVSGCVALVAIFSEWIYNLVKKVN